MNPTNEHREQAREIVRDWASEMPTVSWYDFEALVVKNLPSELDATDIIEHIASALSSRDTEVREVLEGLRYSEVGWCWCKGPGHHSKACEAARALYAKLQAKGVKRCH